MSHSAPAHRSSFVNQLEQNLKRLTVAGQSLLLAVSGGRDSMALLRGMTRLRGVLEIPQIVVAHLDHGLRGDAGRQDAELVRSVCQSLDVAAFISECPGGRNGDRSSFATPAKAFPMSSINWTCPRSEPSARFALSI